MTKKELTRDEQRAKDRQDELDRQAVVDEAMEKFYKEQRAEAEQALKDQREFETTGIRKVVGKP